MKKLCAAFACAMLVNGGAQAGEITDPKNLEVLQLALDVNALPCPEIKRAIIVEEIDVMKIWCGQRKIDEIDPRLVYRVRLNENWEISGPLFFIDPW